MFQYWFASACVLCGHEKFFSLWRLAGNDRCNGKFFTAQGAVAYGTLCPLPLLSFATLCQKGLPR